MYLHTVYHASFSSFFILLGATLLFLYLLHFHFTKHTSTRKRSDDLLKFIITPACESSGYISERVDQIYHTDKIDNKIIEYLKNSELVIADVTEENANAFFELGYRIATGRPVIQMAEEGSMLPFDVMTTNTIFYSTTDLAKADEAKNKLSATIKQIAEQEEVLARVSSEQDGGSQTNSVSSTEILATLFQIQNSIADIQESLKANNSETILNRRRGKRWETM